MPLAKCVACEKVLDVEPIRCPYCTVIQPSKAVDTFRLAVQRAVLALLCLGAGGAAGFWTGRKTASPPQAAAPGGELGLATLARLAKGSAEFKNKQADFRQRLAAEIASARSEGRYQPVEAEDIMLQGELHRGRSVFLVGYANFVEVDGRGDHFTLFTSHGTGANLGVDIMPLPAERKKALLKAQWPPHMVLVKGRIEDGHVGWGERPLYHLRLESFADLGESSSGQSASELLKESIEE